MPKKLCTKCGVYKEETDFYVNYRNGNLQNPCKSCVKSRQQAVKFYGTDKVCSFCKELKNVNLFYKRWNGYTTYCIECSRKKFNIKPFINPYTENGKICSGCKTIKPFSEYHKSGNNSKVRSYCINCGIERYRKQKYGITSLEYNNIIIKQNYSCKICKNKFDDKFIPNIDHDHNKGVNFRGILCNKCNKGLGIFKDDTQIIKKAAFYLKKPPLEIPLLEDNDLKTILKGFNRKEKIKYYNLKNKINKLYSLNVSQYNCIISKNSCCNICNAVFNRNSVPNIDHCHKTSTIRGILCRECNLGIGHFNDDVELLESAIRYLEYYK